MFDFKVKPFDYSFLFLDMNSYFATVEQQVNPVLRGKPLVVTPYTGNSGCVIASSREAKELGIRVGFSVGEARRKYSEVIVVESRPALYMIYHEEIKKSLENFSPYALPLSIDEFKIRLTGSDRDREKALKLAGDIKKSIRKIGDYLTCSVGIGPSSFLAKVASERKKPDGLTLIELKNLAGFYRKLNLRDLPGINFAMDKQLAMREIYSCEEFFRKDLLSLSKMFGHFGKVWYYRLRGYEVDDFVSETKTCGHSHVLPPDLRTKEGAISVLEKLVSKVGYRLRRDKFVASGVFVSIGFTNRSKFHRAKRCPFFSDSRTLSTQVKEILKECKEWERPIYVAVSAFGLVRDRGEQISIFADIEKSKMISKSLDKINDQFGANTIYPASLFGARNSAPDRISFGRPRYDIIN